MSDPDKTSTFSRIKNERQTAQEPVGSEDPQDLTLFVQSLLEQMQSRFAQMSDAIIGRIDEMGNRIDDLEKSIGDLMEQANEESVNNTPVPKPSDSNHTAPS